MNPFQVLERSVDIDFLKKILNVYLPIDYANLTEENFGFLCELEKKPIEEILEEKRKVCDKLKKTVEERIQFLEK